MRPAWIDDAHGHGVPTQSLTCHFRDKAVAADYSEIGTVVGLLTYFRFKPQLFRTPTSMTNSTCFLTLIAVLGSAGCATTTPQAGSAPTTATVPPGSRAPSGQREQWLEMFARGYFPGRSGQIFVVPREGEVITERDPLYRFMHGSPWDYDTHIPILFYGAPFIRQGSLERCRGAAGHRADAWARSSAPRRSRPIPAAF